MSVGKSIAHCAVFLLLSLRVVFADPILDWNALMIEAIRNDNSGPTLSSRNLAILHTAMYDAVNSVLKTHQPYRTQADPVSPTSASGAAVGAGYEIMKALYPTFLARTENLYASYVGDGSDEAIQNGLTLGRSIAQAALEFREADGSTTDVPYIPSDLPGQWRRTAPFYRPPVAPNWRYVTLFCLPELETFVPPPPPTLESDAYAESFNEVKALGGTASSLRTPYQAQTATFWSDFSYTSMPPGHWHLLAETISRDYQNSLAQNARLFALISLAQADAAIVCWEAKYRFNLWRPITAVQQADGDNNPLTEADLKWNHYLNAPPFPSYPSGHSAFSKASAEVITYFYNTDAISFTAGSDALPGVFRTFNSVAACADEVGMSRIYGGIHFQFDNIAGKASGKKIANYITQNFLIANDSLPYLKIESVSAVETVLRMHGQIGEAFTLETSPDLREWSFVTTAAAKVGGVTVLHQRGPHERTRFFRIKPQ